MITINGTNIFGDINTPEIHKAVSQFFSFKNGHEDIRFISLINLLMLPMLFLIGWFSISLETQLVLSLYMILLGLTEKYVKNKTGV